MSGCGRQSGADAEQLKDELIDAAEVGELVGLSERQVRRRHADFDGRLKSGVWLFPRRVVMEYREWQRTNATG